MKNLFTKVFALFVLALFVTSLFAPTANAALSEAQRRLFAENIAYFDIEVCGGSTTGGSISPGAGAADGAQFPNLDPTAMASSIKKFIKKENSRSKMKNLGPTIVASAKRANVSPFLIVAIAREESSMSDPGDYNVSGGNNSFGRMASSSQPSFPGAGPNAGTAWYKWSSVKASVDFSAQENKNVSGGGDIAAYLRNQYGDSIDGSNLVSLFLKYAPPSGNDTQQYIANVKGWINDMVRGAGGSAGAAAPSGGSACCPGGGSATLTGSNNAEKAFNYFLGPQLNLSPEGAAGLLGNLQQESGLTLNTRADNGSHRGIAQWDTAPGGRWANLETQEHGKDLYDIATQLDFIRYELTEGGYESVYGKLKNASSTDEAAKVVFDDYEKPGDSTLPTRQTNAKKILNQYGGGGGGGGGGGSCPASAGTVGGYKNPLRDVNNLGPARIDMGVDYTGSGPIYAIGKGTVKNLTNSGWPAGTFISYKLTDGPAKGKYVYVAENCKPIKVHVGQKVDSNTVLCKMIDAYPHIELGWAQPPGSGDTIAKHNGGYTEGYATAAGENFNDLMVKLGAPSGTQQPKMGNLPSGWPTW